MTIMSPELEELVSLRPIPVEVRCRCCHGWIATVPHDTPWVRGRCFNRIEGRNCRLYGVGQTVKLKEGGCQ